ncbi:group III truncated hemoglobin [Sphingobacterium bambusae]|uniref:Group III truncated hemoglobin n=1 Tax=Sphingobacterium bambusae TaxID=662858 RepID=A0ABW6BEJ5_9SPHI|nr:group III truncated hemoglobin [Sphingobacterium bambusae]WPL47614.1 group III truncated hemoglobin [Sphingobacterium bambusae]
MRNTDIQTLDDIRLLVDSFYGKVQQDQQLGPIFQTSIQDRWPQHLSKMYSFWQTILLDEHTYNGRPFPPHARLPIDKAHFERWLQLFHETVDELFQGTVAEEAKSRGNKMAALFQIKLEHIRQSPFPPLL